jgi:hypothetical protein
MFHAALMEGVMKTLKKMLKPILKDFAPTERFSLRSQAGVEIYEHETVDAYNITRPVGSQTRGTRDPRLVIIESSQTENGWIAKTRSEIAGLAAILCSVKAVR